MFSTDVVQKDDISSLLNLQKSVLRRSKRINGRDTVSKIIKDGNAKRSPIFVVRYLPNEKGTNRYGVVVSKKMERSAVKRNRIRRRVYEIIRLLEKNESLALPESSDIILLARKPAPKATYDEMTRAIRSLLVK